VSNRGLALVLDALRPDGPVSHNHKAGPTGTFRSSVVSAADLPAVTAQSMLECQWMSIATLDPSLAGVRGRGGKADIRRLMALPCDFDVKKGAFESKALIGECIDRIIAGIGHQPVAVVDTGHGLQPWWVLSADDPAWRCTGDSDPKWAAINAILKRWGRFARRECEKSGASMDSVFDSSRVMRIPGTLNTKDPLAHVAVTIHEKYEDWEPITYAALDEALTVNGFPPRAEDTETVGEAVIAMADVTPPARSCPYATAILEGLAGDEPGPSGRHPWLIGKSCRLWAAYRYGCLAEEDLGTAFMVLRERFLTLIADPRYGNPRPEGPNEVTDAFLDMRRKVEGWTDDYVCGELTPRNPDLFGEARIHSHERESHGDSSAAGTDVEARDGDDAPDSRPWRPKDLTDALSGTHETPEADLLERTDGKRLLYRGKTHSFHGESESGKSFIAQYVCANALLDGERVLYVDGEDSEVGLIIRLRAMGAPDDAILDRFDYLNPDESHEHPGNRTDFADILKRTYAVAVLDGVTNLLSLYGAATNDADEYTSWFTRLPRRIADETNAAVILIDHVSKDREGRGRHSIGTQAKMNTLSGAAYVLEKTEVTGLGLRGTITMRLGKDRPGAIRPFSGPYRKSDHTQEAARASVDSTGPTTVITFHAPGQQAVDDGTTSEPRAWRPTALMERASRWLEGQDEPQSGKAIEADVGGQSKGLREALKILVRDGYLSRTEGRRGAQLHQSLRPYRQSADPQSDAYAGAVPGGDEVSSTNSECTPSQARNPPRPRPGPRTGDEETRSNGDSTSSGTRSGRGGDEVGRGRNNATQSGQLVIPHAPGEIDPQPVADADVDPGQSEWFPFDDSALDDEPA
jgi:hypothetical protein